MFLLNLSLNLLLSFCIYIGIENFWHLALCVIKNAKPQDWNITLFFPAKKAQHRRKWKRCQMHIYWWKLKASWIVCWMIKDIFNCVVGCLLDGHKERIERERKLRREVMLRHGSSTRARTTEAIICKTRTRKEVAYKYKYSHCCL